MLGRPDAARICLRDEKNLVIPMTYNARDEDQGLRFPGGRMDPEDADWIECAIREFYQETGILLERHQIRYLTWYKTKDGRRVIVGIVDQELTPKQLRKLTPTLDDGEHPRPVTYAQIRKGRGIKRKNLRIAQKVLNREYRAAA